MSMLERLRIASLRQRTHLPVPSRKRHPVKASVKAKAIRAVTPYSRHEKEKMSDGEELEIEQDQGLSNFFPTSFGKQGKQQSQQQLLERSRRQAVTKPQRAQPQQVTADDSDDDSGDQDADDSEDSDEEQEEEYPVSHEMVIRSHEKAITSVTLDPAGARLITGSLDCHVNLHDFAAMTPSTIRAFKSVDPAATKTSAQVESLAIHKTLFNPVSPAQVLVISAHPQAKIFTRDGEMWTTFVKGDMYIHDMHNTKGHVADVSDGAWHPSNELLCATCGSDSTVRIWDVENPRSQRNVLVYRSKRTSRTKMTAVAWSTADQGSSSSLVAAGLDGSLIMWNGDGPFNRPTAIVEEAHRADTWTGGLDVSSDGRLVVTRGGDDTIKVWDVRKFKSPVNSCAFTSTSSKYPTTAIKFAPDNASIITGSEDGRLCILNPATLRSELETPVTPGSTVISVVWHPALNQIVTGSANGETHVLYSPTLSTNGAKAVMSRASKRRHIDDDPNMTTDLSQGLIVDSSGNLMNAAAGHAASKPKTIGLTASGKSRDPRRPFMPSSTPFARNNPDSEYVKNSIPLSEMQSEDPREALLKYAGKEALFTKAYKDTQPQTLYAALSDDEDPEPQTSKKPRLT